MAVKSSDPIDILLEMGIDLDNLSEEEDYLSALKEAIAIILVKTKGAGDERSKVLLDEVVKVRKSRKAADPKFKAKKTTIKPDAFFDKKKPDEQQKPVPGQKALPGTVGGGAIVKPSDIKFPEKEEEKDTKLLPGNDILKDILRGVNSILGTLQNQNKFTKKQSEKDRKSAEKKKRGAQEDKLEKGALATFASGAKKLLKPVTNFFADILKFIGTVLIGRLLVKIIDWMSDDENQEKLTAIGDFFKNTWPILLAAYLLFGNSFGRFAVKLIKVVGGFVFKLVSKIIPALFGAAKKFGFGKSAALVGTAVGGVMLAGRMMDGGEDDKDLTQPDGKQKTPSTDNPAEPEPPSVSGRFDIEANQGYINDKPVALEEYQSFTNMSDDEKVQKYGTSMKGGGKVPGSGPNKDTVPAMLAPGEFVMSRGAVSKYGADTLASMNAAGGGTNLPKRMNGVTHAVGGGLMGDISDYGYGDDKKEKPSSKVQSEMEERAESKPKSDQQDSKTDGGFLSGITGGIKSLFGGGGGDNEKKDDGEDTKTKGGISKNAKALLNTIRWAEGTLKPDGYNTWFGGRSDMDLTGMTINEVVAEQKRRLSAGEATYGQYTSAAVGAYQMMTPEAFAAAAGLSGDSKFTPENQDKMAIAGYMMGQAGMSAAEIDAPISREQIAKMAPVWASLPNMSGASQYGQPVKKYEDLVSVYEKNQKGLDASSFTATTGIAAAPGASSSGGSSGGKSSSGGKMSAEDMSDLFSDYDTIAKVNAGPSLLDLYNEQERFAGRPEGFKPGGLKFKKPPSSTSDLENNSRSTTNLQQKGAEGAGGMGNQSNASPNPAATNVAPSNDLPEIDANAMISQEKIKVLGITVV